VRYRLPGGTLGVSSVPDYVSTLMRAALWLGVALLGLRLLGLVGARRRLHRAKRAWACAVGRALELELTLEGLEHIDPGQAYVVTPLHEGLADAVVLLHLPLPLRFAVRDEFLAWRFLGPTLRDTNQVFIRPERGASSYWQLLRAGRQLFDKGESLVVFPQGSILGVETDFAAGAFRLARALCRPLLPVALTGSHRVWEHPYSPRLCYGQSVSLRVLPPVPLEEVRTQPPEKVRRAVQRRLKAEALSGTMTPPRRFVPERDGYWDGYAYRIDPAFADLFAKVALHRRRPT
jgi:1-acyl-sn-glycerol-3-phosphate acyltransferase